MIIGVISDIHLEEQKSEEELLEELTKCINKKSLDIMLIAGDISEDFKRSMEFIKKLKQGIKARIYYTAGNHDLWSKHNEEYDMEGIIKEFSKDESFVFNRAVELDDEVVLIAGCGWYDYSFGDSNFKLDEFEEKEHNGKTWQDKLYAKHELSDIELHNIWNEELISLLMKYSDKKIIFMTHMVNHPDFCVDKSHPNYEMWKYFNAFLGSQELYFMTKCQNVQYAISAHVHYRESFQEGDTYYMCRCLGYQKEFELFGGEPELEEQIENAIEVIEIE